MRTLVVTLTLGLAALGTADRAAAAALDVITETPVIDVPFATADYIETSGVGDLSIFAAEGVSFDLVTEGPLLIDLFVDFDVVDPTGSAGGALFSMDDAGAVLDGDLVAAGYDGEILELLFGDLTGSAADAFGDFALASVFFNDPVPGDDPLANLIDGTAYDVSVELASVAPIPLPAALPMLAAGLGGLVLLRRRG